MGAVVSKAASGIGSVLGSAFVAPIKAIFGRSCEGICSGTWDLICFIEHLCIASLVRLFIVSVLTYIILLFFYLLFKVGIIQCIGRSFCKMTWAACEAYWTALEDISCFFWHKLKNTKRFYRRRFEDMEEEFNTTDTDSSKDYESIRVTNRQKSVRDKRKDRVRQSLHPKSHSSLKRRQRSGLRHHVRLKTSEVSVHVEGSRRRKKAGLIQVRSREQHIGPKLFNRR